MINNLTAELKERKKTLDALGIPTLPSVWLRPHRQDDLPQTASKIGGKIAWPPDKPWPICDATDQWLHDGDVQNDFYLSLAQFRRDEFPEISFPTDSDIFQILLCPRHHEDPDSELGVLGPQIKGFWHRLADLKPGLNPKPKCPYPYLIPFECLLRPLRVEDPPPLWRLTDKQQDRIKEEYKRSLDVQADASRSLPNWYYHGIGTVRGAKLLGQPLDDDRRVNRTCICGNYMPLLFSIHSWEVDSDPDHGSSPHDTSAHFRRVVGLDALEGSLNIFYCDVCPDRPITTQHITG